MSFFRVADAAHLLACLLTCLLVYVSEDPHEPRIASSSRVVARIAAELVEHVFERCWEVQG